MVHYISLVYSHIAGANLTRIATAKIFPTNESVGLFWRGAERRFQTHFDFFNVIAEVFVLSWLLDLDVVLDESKDFLIVVVIIVVVVVIVDSVVVAFLVSIAVPRTIMNNY